MDMVLIVLSGVCGTFFLFVLVIERRISSIEKSISILEDESIARMKKHGSPTLRNRKNPLDIVPTDSEGICGPKPKFIIWENMGHCGAKQFAVHEIRDDEKLPPPDEGLEVCEHCGSTGVYYWSQKAAMICRYCGKPFEVEPDRAYCPTCQYYLERPDQVK